MTTSITLDEQATALEDALVGHPTVDSASIDTDRRPHRVEAVLRSGNVPDGVRDILEQMGATIEDARVQDPQDDGGMLLLLRPAAQWRPAGQRTIRAHGGSIVCTLTREALEASDLGEDDEVDLEAREGQVRITRREA